MAIIGAMSGVLEMETKDWKAGAKAAQKDVEGIGASFKKFNSQLKADFGKGSAFGQAMKLMVGGGAIAAVGMAANELDKFAKKIEELNVSYARGKISGMEYFGEITASLPIFGPAGDAIFRFANAFTAAGKAEAIAKANLDDYNRVTEVAIKNSQAWGKETKDLAKSLEEQAKKSQQAVAVAALPEDKRAAQEILNNAQNELDKIQEEADKAIHQDQIDSLESDLKRLQGLKHSVQNDNLINRDKLELKRLVKDREDIWKAADDARQQLNQETDAKLLEEQEKQNTKMKELADKAAKDEEEAKRKVLEQEQQENEKQLRILQQQRKDILKSTNAPDDKIAQTPAFRGGSLSAIYAPQVASRIEQLTKENRDHLASIDAGIKTLTGKDPDDDDDSVANF